MLGPFAMRHVEAEDGDAALHEVRDSLGRTRGGPQRRHDLRAPDRSMLSEFLWKYVRGCGPY